MKTIDPTAYFKKVVEPELDTCTTAEAMLTVVAYHYCLDKKLGILTHQAFKLGLTQAVYMLRPEVRHQDHVPQ
jgi:hypothetical protein